MTQDASAIYQLVGVCAKIKFSRTNHWGFSMPVIYLCHFHNVSYSWSHQTAELQCFSTASRGGHGEIWTNFGWTTNIWSGRMQTKRSTKYAHPFELKHGDTPVRFQRDWKLKRHIPYVLMNIPYIPERVSLKTSRFQILPFRFLPNHFGAKKSSCRYYSIYASKV